MGKSLSRLLEVAVTDPEDARRRKLLNILLAGVGAIGLLALLATLVFSMFGAAGQPGEVNLLLIACISLIIGAVVIYVINRFSGWVASTLFLALIILIAVLADQPVQVAEGRSIMNLVIPIIAASVLLRPATSFVAATVCSVVIAFISLFVLHTVPNFPAMFIFFIVALIAWLSARSLENALADLRAINRELDQRVAQRTQELAEALATVHAEASKSKAILEGIADGVIVFDTDGKAIIANPAASNLLGYPTEEIIDRDIQALMETKVRSSDQEVISSLLSGQEMRQPSVKVGWGDKTLSVSLARVTDASGNPIGTVAVFRDFTREAELDRMKSTIISMTSHELRTPVTAILGYADMLKESAVGALTDEQHGVIQRIIFNCQRLSNLISNLLDQAQIEAGTLKLTYTYFTPSSLIEEMVATVGLAAQVKGLELVTAVTADTPPLVYGDAQRVSQVLVNLVSNAIKYTDQGSVLVRIFRPDEGHWGFEVADTGSGIPQEAQDYIFEPFRRADDSLTRKSSGAGLGLSIVKQLVNLMKGEIRLTSTVGSGSTFTVILPLSI